MMSPGTWAIDFSGPTDLVVRRPEGNHNCRMKTKRNRESEEEVVIMVGTHLETTAFSDWDEREKALKIFRFSEADKLCLDQHLLLKILKTMNHISKWLFKHYLQKAHC